MVWEHFSQRENAISILMLPVPPFATVVLALPLKSRVLYGRIRKGFIVASWSFLVWIIWDRQGVTKCESEQKFSKNILVELFVFQ
jgi:hypothetical protein